MRLAVAEVVVFYTTSAVINITNTGVANVMRRAVVELPIAVDRQRIAELEQVVREQHNLETMGERRSR
jgi:alpha-galactosidase/6-phospho-beta-glucosidase family protein